MAEDLYVIEGTKEEQYKALIPQIKALLEGEPDMVANMANMVAALKQQFNWLWVGFYIVRGNELVLGPFQGPIACTRIKKGKGVCGTSWADQKTLIVPDVDQFPGHIACSSLSKSEIVLPVIRNHEVVAVLDVDSIAYDSFDEIDSTYLSELLELIDIPQTFAN
jgi:GAF domain-containing protein